MKKRKNSNLRKLLFVSSFSLWAVVFLVSFFVLQTGGHLLPLAANLEKPGVRFTIEGRISNRGGVNIANSKFIIFENGLKHTYITDSNGWYIIYDLVGGSYKINVEAEGYKGFSGSILIDGQHESVQNFILSK